MNDSSSLSMAQLIKTYDEELRRVLFRRCGCLDTAADIVQETYHRMLSGELWRQADNPRALMHRIAANLATDHERRDAVRDRYISQNQSLPEWIDETDHTQPERILSARERLDRIAAIVNKLPPKCRHAFILRKVNELSHTEIAEHMGISRNMVEKHLRNALLALQQLEED